MTHNEQQDDPFVTQVKGVLDQSLEELDTPTRTELQRLRYQALSRTPRRRMLRKPVWGLVPVAVVLLLMVLVNRPEHPSFPQGSPATTDLQILTDTVPLDFYAQDIAFYLWLAENVPGDAALPGRDAQPQSVLGESGASRTQRSEGRIGAELGTDRVSRDVQG